jgi:hypothetical protein
VKGLELGQRFFEEVGFPAIREHLPECVSHITVGLSGGSQSHGNDDEISRDHGWGASFMVWLKRLSACLIWSNEWGIKHLMRAEQRGEYVTAAM